LEGEVRETQYVPRQADAHDLPPAIAEENAAEQPSLLNDVEVSGALALGHEHCAATDLALLVLEAVERFALGRRQYDMVTEPLG
jgi:hypothetical protein